MTAPDRTEVLVFGFPQTGVPFEGGLVGALERAESGGAIRVIEVLFAGRDAESGELSVLSLEGGAGELAAALADFRLDRDRRREDTARALEGDTEEDYGAALEAGEAVVAVRVEHTWARALGDAVGRSGGHSLGDRTRGDDVASLRLHALDAARRARVG